MRTLAVAVLVAIAVAVAGCRDTSRFSSHGDRFEGPVVAGSFVRAGLGPDVTMCLTIDTDHLQDGPGTISTSDGRLRAAPLRPIPQIWHDPLSTLSFGEGREQNLVYAAAPSDAQDLTVVVSLMQANLIEVRLLRGAPQPDAAAPPPGEAPPVFGVFTLRRQSGPCAY